MQISQHEPQKLCLFSHAVYRVSKTKGLGEKYLHAIPNNMTLLTTKNIQTDLWVWKIQQAKAMSFLRKGIQHDWKETISGVHVHASPGSAEILVRRGGTTNHHLIARSLSNLSAKRYQNRMMCVEFIVFNLCSTSHKRTIVGCVIVFETQCICTVLEADHQRRSSMLLLMTCHTHFWCIHFYLPQIHSCSGTEISDELCNQWL